MPGVSRRRIGLYDPHPLLGFDGDSAMKESGVLLASAAGVAVQGGTNEVQTITVTGTPTGGNFTLTYEGATTAAIAHSASAATVVAALELLPNIGAGNVAGGGGALPGTAVTITFQGALAKRNVTQMTAAHAFTGGTTPAIAVTTTTAGSAIDSTILRAKRGLILKKGGAANSKLVPCVVSDVTADIVGVLADSKTFIAAVSPENDEPAAYYTGPGLTFNAAVLTLVQPAAYTGAFVAQFLTWAQQNGNRVGTQAL